MRILIIGSGGREHALAAVIAKSKKQLSCSVSDIMQELHPLQPWSPSRLVTTMGLLNLQCSMQLSLQ
nr:hypothetical protein [uncultured Sphaerochaeta sp.]